MVMEAFMQSENYQEYRMIREEVQSLKDCMTNYVGFVLGGSGVAIFGLANLPAKENPWGIALASLFLSLLISMVLLLIFYKFKSHNRYLGYAKLLSQETFKRPSTDEIVTWEICVEKLRSSEGDFSVLESSRNNIRNDIVEPSQANLDRLIKYYLRDPAYRRREKRWETNQRRLPRSNSWGFPPLVVGIFGILCAGFLSIGLRFAIAGWCSCETANWICIYRGVGIILTIALIYLWIIFHSQIRQLMYGRMTIEAYFWKFLFIRAEYLILLGYQLSYSNTDARIAQL
jgi:hypothetical protein